MDDRRKYNHITPKFILNNFAFKKKKKKNKSIYYVYWYKKETKEDIRKATDDICGQNYLYEMLNENNEIDKEVNFNINEKGLEKLESNIWAPLCNKIIEDPNVELTDEDIVGIYYLVAIQQLRTPVEIEITKKLIKKIAEPYLNKKLDDYVLDQWAKTSIFPFHGLGENASFTLKIVLDRLFNNNRIVIYRINEKTTDSRFVINGEEPIVLHSLEGKITLTNWYFPIAPTVCLGLIDDSLMRNTAMIPLPMFFEAQEYFVKQINRTSLDEPGRALVSQIKINENRRILF